MPQLIWPTAAAAIAASDKTKVVAPLTWDPVSHVLSRFAFGATDALRTSVTKSGVDSWINAQIALGQANPGYGAHPDVAAIGTLLGKNPYDTRMWLKARNNEYGWDAFDQLTQVTLGLQAFSPAQLYETLVDFFANHLNVANHNGEVWNTRHTFDRDVIRKYAMGSFTDMLLASAKHPAMLIFLNLADSTKEAINENYGRELLELHTVGLNYTESDVQNCAALLTGRTLDDNQHYLFNSYIHPTGAVRVLGFSTPNANAETAEAAGDALLRYLAGHQFTAQNLARKLCVRFVSDSPSATLVRAVADSYLANKTQILPMIRTILCSTEFWESRGRKVRRPAENVVASLRAVGTTVTDYGKATQTLHWITNSMDNCPLDWPAPNGYPDVAAAWRSAGSLLNEWNVHLGMAGGWWDGFSEPPTAPMYGGGTPTTSGQAVAMLTKYLTGMTFSAEHLAALQGLLEEPASTPMTKSKMQWLAKPMVALILHAPHHALR